LFLESIAEKYFVSTCHIQFGISCMPLIFVTDLLLIMESAEGSVVFFLNALSNWVGTFSIVVVVLHVRTCCSVILTTLVILLYKSPIQIALYYT